MIFVFDTTDADSFENIEEWINDVTEHAGENIQKVLLGNKTDLIDKRTITTEEGK